jgi:hypothetical protein
MSWNPSGLATHGSPGGERRATDPGRLLLGAVVVAIGTLFLLDSAGVVDAGDALERWWPLPLVAAGLLTFAERPPAVGRGLVLTAVGAVLLLFTTDVLGDDAWAYVWPAAIVVAGLAILSRWRGRAVPSTPGTETDDVIRTTAVFGGPELVSTSQAFRGAYLTAVFGGAKLDLRGARPAPGGAAVNATVAFGGVELIVPRGWRISVRCTPIFGGLEDKTDHSVPAADDAPVLRVDAVCLFGGVEIKHARGD